MQRSGLVIAGGILGILRGAFGGLTGISVIGDYAAFDAIIPGASGVLGFELLVSVLALAGGIWALVVSGNASKAGAITALGWVILSCGLVDLIWATALMGSSALASAAGSLFALALIGALLIAGGRSLQKRAAEPAGVAETV